MTTFSVAMDALFTNPDIGLDATYNGSAVRVVKQRADVAGQLNQVSFQMSAAGQKLALIVDIRKSQVATPARGDTLVIAGSSYPVREFDLDTLDGVIWTLGLGPPV